MPGESAHERQRKIIFPREGRLWNSCGTHKIHKRFLTESTGSTWVGKEQRDNVETVHTHLFRDAAHSKRGSQRMYTGRRRCTPLKTHVRDHMMYSEEHETFRSNMTHAETACSLHSSLIHCDCHKMHSRVSDESVTQQFVSIHVLEGKHFARKYCNQAGRQRLNANSCNTSVEK